MARTRAQEQAAVSGKESTPEAKSQKEAESKPGRAGKKGATSRKPTKPAAGKRSHEGSQGGRKEEGKPKSAKKPKTSAASERKPANPSNPKVSALLSKYGVIPLQETKLADPSRPLPDTLLALVFNAMLTSARISHELAARSVSCLIDAGYQDIHTLKNSSWQERTEVLTKGGYTHYREKTATSLGELADLVLDKYDGDLNNILKHTDSSPAKIRASLKEIKGVGGVGLDIFCDTAQGVWPCLAPFIDPRSLKVADQLGLGSVEELWREVDQDPMMMCKLATALTTVRLDKKVGEFTS